MATRIEWAEETWNPTAGCDLVSPGCTNCYAMRMASRLEAMGQEKYAGTTRKVNGNVVWTGRLNLDEDSLVKPLTWRTPRRVFVNSMSDLFHEAIPDAFIDRVFAVMALCPQHTFLILTKRPERMERYVRRIHEEGFPVLDAMQKIEVDPWWRLAGRTVHLAFDEDGRIVDVQLLSPLRNVWLLISAERQQELEARIGPLMRTPAFVRGISAEPLLGALKLWEWEAFDGRLVGPAIIQEYQRGPNTVDGPGGTEGSSYQGIDWVIVGGESGAGARPCDADWIASLVKQCRLAQVACFVKQLGKEPRQGGALLLNREGRYPWRDRKGGDWSEWPDRLKVRQYPEEDR